jgi:hypothetical protein
MKFPAKSACRIGAEINLEVHSCQSPIFGASLCRKIKFQNNVKLQNKVMLQTRLSYRLSSRGDNNIPTGIGSQPHAGWTFAGQHLHERLTSTREEQSPSSAGSSWSLHLADGIVN